MPSAGCLPRCNRRAGGRTGRFERAAFRPRNLQRLRKSRQPASAREGNRNAAAGEIGAVGNAGREAERGGDFEGSGSLIGVEISSIVYTFGFCLKTRLSTQK